MQQAAAEVMKSSQTIIHKKSDWLDSNRSRRLARWGFNFTERKSRALEISIQQFDRPNVADIKKRSSAYLQAAVKLSDTAHVLSRSKHLMGLSKPRQATIIPLPPIKGSKTITDASPSDRKKSEQTKANQVFLLVKQVGKVNQELNKSDKIGVAGHKAPIKDPETHSRLIQETSDDQPAATSTVSLRERPTQRRLCSNDTAIETESELSVAKGHLRVQEDSDDEEEEYYTEQKITEWILKVNSSLFSTGDYEQKPSKPAEEQDVGTIKIIYSGD